MEDPHETVRAFIASRAGLVLRDTEIRRIDQAVAARMQGLRFSSLRQYCERLRTDDSEWRKLIPMLTTGETYFLRDQGHCGVLERVILPELIDRNRAHRSLRIWSAGCATGEEAYSLAMLVHQALPLRSVWDVRIVGSDINEEALERARRARYGAWSFRMVGTELRTRYFEPHGDEWQLKEFIRGMVTFRSGNLVTDRIPDRGSALHDLDLIVCRNVFIYFHPEAIARVLGKLAEALVPGGVLLTGHAELHGQPLGALRRRMLPGAVVYERARPETAERGEATWGAAAGLAQPEPPVPPPRSRPTVVVADRPSGAVIAHADTAAERAERVLAEATARFDAMDYRGAIAWLRSAADLSTVGFQGALLAAKAYANLGELDRAAAYCRQALVSDPLSAEAYYLLAQLAGERGDRKAVESFLSRVIFLDPASVAAFLELADLYEADGDSERARRHREGALDVLRKLPADSGVPPYTGVTAGELIERIQRVVGSHGGEAPTPMGAA